jgi:hypothetical protein
MAVQATIAPGMKCLPVLKAHAIRSESDSGRCGKNLLGTAQRWRMTCASGRTDQRPFWP